MIRVLQEFDLTVVMQIWLTTNIRAHDFIPKEYWTLSAEFTPEGDKKPLQAEFYGSLKKKLRFLK